MEAIKEIHNSISEFNRQHGQTLEKVILPNEELEAYGFALNQHYPHVQFEGDDIDGRILIQKNPN